MDRSVPRWTRALRAVPRGWDLLTAIVAVFVVFALSSAIAFRNTQSLHEAGSGLVQTYDVVSALDEALLLMSEAESAERAFIITGEERFLQPYQDANTKLDAQIATLARLSEREPLLGRHWPRWRDWIKARQAQLDRAITLRRNQDVAGARAIVMASGTRGEVAAFKAEVLGLERAKLEVREARERQMRDAYRTALLGGTVGTLLGLMLIAALGRYAWRYREIRSQVYADRELLRATLLSIGEGVIATDGQGRVRIINRCAQQLSGWSEQDAQGLDLTRVFRVLHEATRAPLPAPAHSAMQTGEATRLCDDALLVSKNSKEYPVEGTTTPVMSADSGVLGAVVVFRDIGGQRETARALKDSEHRAQSRAGELEALMQSVPAAILIANDLDCHDVTGNAAAYNLLGEPVGSNLREAADQHAYFRTDAGEQTLIRLRQDELPLQRAIAEKREIANVELCLRVRGGDMRTVMANAAPLKDSYGNVRGAVVALIDVTERKHIEAQLTDAHRRKDEFLATLAHELRNPLAPVRSGVAILSKEEDSTVTRKTLAMMERQLSHMVRLIDDLLDVSRITGGKVVLRREPLPLHAVLEQAAEASRPLLDAAGHSFQMQLPEAPLWVHADLSRLCQVVTNLLTNAAKYTPEGGQVNLVLDREQDWGRIRVSDNGLGIPPAVLGEVFNMFTQVNRTLHRSQGGLGVGLSLVKQLVEKHGGTVHAYSEGLGRGSTFTVRLPLAVQTPDIVPRLQAAAPYAGPSLRILVVDDNQDAADSLALVLAADGHLTKVAYSAAQALTIVRGFTPQIAFLDIGMPEVSGHDLAKALRADASFSGMKLVALTGWGEDADRLRSREAGFDMHVTKPIDTATLEGLLTDLCGEPPARR